MLMSNGKLRSPKRNQFPCTQLLRAATVWCYRDVLCVFAVSLPKFVPLFSNIAHNPSHQLSFFIVHILDFKPSKKQNQFRVQMKVLHRPFECCSCPEPDHLKVINLFVSARGFDLKCPISFSLWKKKLPSRFTRVDSGAVPPRLLIVNVTIKLFHMPKSKPLLRSVRWKRTYFRGVAGFWWWNFIDSWFMGFLLQRFSEKYCCCEIVNRFYFFRLRNLILKMLS